MTSFDAPPWMSLPIGEVIGDIQKSLSKTSNLVLVAPPGAGKTTMVPLALLDVSFRAGRKILVLEPRRIAARATAQRMASLLGEQVGERVGYRVRFDTKVSANTVIEVVTDGVFTRMLSADPGLENVAAILFDEFHERSLSNDLALALCLDLQAGLRDDLRLVVMSATLDGASVAMLMDAPVIESAGRAFPVDVCYREHGPRARVDDYTSDAVLQELTDQPTGDVLVFLPGQREIEQVYRRLGDQISQSIQLCRLYGALSAAQQDQALRPAADGKRKVILASAIAETSLTIDGICSVIDSGLARRPEFEPATGLTRLQTVRVSKAEARQRAGRAGRLGPGRAIRLWRKEQTKALADFAPAEITSADLSSLLLDLADWGVCDPADLKWSDTPPAAALNEARQFLVRLGALAPAGMITAYGRALRSLPLAPNLAHMVLTGAKHGRGSAQRAVLLALVISEPGLGGRSTDVAERCRLSEQGRDPRNKRALQLAKKIMRPLDFGPADESLSFGLLLAHGFTDRIAQRTGAGRDGAARYRLANGRGAALKADEALARSDFLVVADMTGQAGAATIRAAAELSKSEIEQEFSDHISEDVAISFGREDGQVSGKSTRMFGALKLSAAAPVSVTSEQAWPVLQKALNKHGLLLLPWTKGDDLLRTRLMFLHQRAGAPWPDMSDEALLNRADSWLLPFMGGRTGFAGLGEGTLSQALLYLAGNPPPQRLDSLVPSHFTVPSGSKIPLSYRGDRAVLSVRPQELFGLDQHPAIGDGAILLDVELLSPAGRPVQLTADLPGFWRGSWKDVRADLRGRYPKHSWPEDPLTAPPTARIKSRTRT